MTNLGILARFPLGVYQGHKADGSPDAFPDPARLQAALPRPVRATFVRFTLEELATLAPGNSVEVRVPPLGVTQCIAGPRHTRGTPPSVVEARPLVWAALVLGACSWAQAVSAGALDASGERSDLSGLLPLF